MTSGSPSVSVQVKARYMVGDEPARNGGHVLEILRERGFMIGKNALFRLLRSLSTSQDTDTTTLVPNEHMLAGRRPEAAEEPVVIRTLWKRKQRTIPTVLTSEELELALERERAWLYGPAEPSAAEPSLARTTQIPS